MTQTKVDCWTEEDTETTERCPPHQTLVTAASGDETLAEAVSAHRVTLGAARHGSPVVTSASWGHQAKSRTRLDTITNTAYVKQLPAAVQKTTGCVNDINSDRLTNIIGWE